MRFLWSFSFLCLKIFEVLITLLRTAHAPWASGMLRTWAQNPASVDFTQLLNNTEVVASITWSCLQLCSFCRESNLEAETDLSNEDIENYIAVFLLTGGLQLIGGLFTKQAMRTQRKELENREMEEKSYKWLKGTKNALVSVLPEPVNDNNLWLCEY